LIPETGATHEGEGEVAENVEGQEHAVDAGEGAEGHAPPEPGALPKKGPWPPKPKYLALAPPTGASASAASSSAAPRPTAAKSGAIGPSPPKRLRQNFKGKPPSPAA
jgi:hypothetical protein